MTKKTPESTKINKPRRIASLIPLAFLVAGCLGLFFQSVIAGTSKNFTADKCTAETNYQGIGSKANTGIEGYSANGSPTESSCVDQSAEGWVTRSYWALFNRAVDSPSLYGTLTKEYMNGSSDGSTRTINTLLSSNESKNNFIKLSPGDKTKQLYVNIMLRQPDDAGLAYWSQEFARPNATVTTIKRFLQSSESLGKTRSRVQDGLTISKLPIVNAQTSAGESKKANLYSLAPYALIGTGDYRYDVAPGFGAMLGNHVLIGTFPSTNNQVLSTMNAMRMNTVNITTGESEWLSIPTNRSKLEAPAPNGFGGADVSDLCTTTSSSGSKVTYGISAVPYKHWNINTLGEFPFLPKFVQTGSGELSYTQADTFATFRQLRSNAQDKNLMQQFLPTEVNSSEKPAGRAGLGECVTLPNGFMAITQYFPDRGKTSGSVIVLNKEGSLVAGLELPTLTDGSGKVVQILPRDINTAPKLIGGKAYISMVADAFDSSGKAFPFPLYEFTYDVNANKLEQLHAAFISGGGKRFTRSAYLPNGDLVADTLNPNGSDPNSIFRSSGTTYYSRQKLGSINKTSTVVQTVAPDKIVSPTPSNVEPVAIDIAYSEKRGVVLQASSLGSVSAYKVPSMQLCGRLDPNLAKQIPKYDSAALFGGLLKGPYDEDRDYWWLPMRIRGNNLTKAPLLYGINVAALTKAC